MIRLARLAVLAALATALGFSLHASALATTRSAATLTPARMFDRDAESLFALVIPSRVSTIVSAALFNVQTATTQTLPAPTAPPLPPVAQVNLTLPARPAIGASNLPVPVLSVTPLYADDAPLIAPSIDLNLSAGTVLPAASQPVRFGAYEPYVPTLEAVSAGLSVPLRLGPVHFTEQVVSSAMQTLHPDAFRILQVCGTIDQAAPCPYLADSRAQSIVAATSFNVRTGASSVGLQVSGGLEHFSLAQNAAFPYVPMDPDPQAAMLNYPGMTDLVKRSLGAKLAVPVTPRVTLGLQYESQRYQGEYGAMLFPGLDARKDTYLGNVTYLLPNSSSVITFSARQNRYQDAFSSNYNLTQTRADLNFTVKF